jgi:hypothetical protein
MHGKHGSLKVQTLESEENVTTCYHLLSLRLMRALLAQTASIYHLGKTFEALCSCQ